MIIIKIIITKTKTIINDNNNSNNSDYNDTDDINNNYTLVTDCV